MSNLKLLNDKNPINNLKFLSDFEGIMDKIKDKSQNTQKSYLISVIVDLSSVASSDPKLIKKYEIKRDALQETYNNILASHSKTPSQEENWVTWDEFLELVEKVGDSVKYLDKKKDWSDAEILKYQEYLIMMLYKNYPVRNDWATMKVLTQREYKKLPQDSKKNFLVVITNKKPMFKFILNSYKTSAKYSQKIIEVKDSALEKVIRKFLLHQQSEFFTVSPVGTLGDRALTSNELTKLFGLVSTRILGKRLGSSLLRHIYLSSKYGDEVKEKDKDAELMMHSLGMQDGYIKTD
jgi:hypothetical protein